MHRDVMRERAIQDKAERAEIRRITKLAKIDGFGASHANVIRELRARVRDVVETLQLGAGTFAAKHKLNRRLVDRVLQQIRVEIIDV